jgi:hypothetical protein
MKGNGANAVTAFAAIPYAEVSGGPQQNLVIGGDFSSNPWIRGTSFAAIATGAYSADRWVFFNSSAAVCTVQRTVDAPTVVQAGHFTQHCLHIDCTTADASVAAGDLLCVIQAIEGYRLAALGFGQAGSRQATLKFWVKATKVGIYCVAFKNSASDRCRIEPFLVVASNVWEQKSITIPVDTSGTWLYDNLVGMRLCFTLMGGTTYQGVANVWQAGNYFCTAAQVDGVDSTANDFKIALVSLVAGAGAATYPARSVPEERDLCRRYAREIPVNAGGAIAMPGIKYATTYIEGILYLDQEMRAAPTLTNPFSTTVTWNTTTAASNTVAAYNLATAAWTTITGALTVSIVGASPTSLLLRFAAGTSFSGTDGQPVQMQMGPINPYVLSAEL